MLLVVHKEGLKVVVFLFYKIPKGKTSFEARCRLGWVKTINRNQWSEEQISRTRICGHHFVSG